LVYRYFIKGIKDLPNVRFTIQTNGLLIKKMYQRHLNMFEKLDVLNISIDGATKTTYELLRRGGQFEKLLENLEFIKDYHQQFEIKIHMVVQKSNWQEMGDMLDLADRFNVHQVIFNRITNWNTYNNFNEQLVPELDEVFINKFNAVKKHPKSITWQLA
jgi:MoaA/NifB/PqqE/SkfB family radical SAM enzyme